MVLIEHDVGEIVRILPEGFDGRIVKKLNEDGEWLYLIEFSDETRDWYKGNEFYKKEPRDF
jgi:hypothetical protein